MCEIFNRQLSDDAVAFWMEELTTVYGEHLFTALREGMREKWMPSVGSVLERARALMSREESDKRQARRRKLDTRAAELDKIKKAEWDALPEEQREKFNAEWDAFWLKRTGNHRQGGEYARRSKEPRRGMGRFRSSVGDEMQKIQEEKYGMPSDDLFGPPPPSYDYDNLPF